MSARKEKKTDKEAEPPGKPPGQPVAQAGDIEIFRLDEITPNNLTGMLMQQWKWVSFAEFLKKAPNFVVVTTVHGNAVALVRQGKRRNVGLLMRKLRFRPDDKQESYLIFRKEIEPALVKFPFLRKTYGTIPRLAQELLGGNEVEIASDKMRFAIYNYLVTSLRNGMTEVYRKFRKASGRNAPVWHEKRHNDGCKVRLLEQFVKEAARKGQLAGNETKNKKGGNGRTQGKRT